MPGLVAAAEPGGIVGWATGVLDAAGEWGVGLFTLLETVFPPIPSEVILPLAGFLSQQGRMNLVLALVLSVAGAYLGALALYALGALLGLERSVRWLSKLPLVDRDDFERAFRWFDRHGRAAVLVGRVIPGVRSLVSLPAGAARMNLLVFSLFTLLGTAVWNGALIGLGALLGSQYRLIEQYSRYLNGAVYVAVVALIVWLVIRRVRRRRRPSTGGATAQEGSPDQG